MNDQTISESNQGQDSVLRRISDWWRSLPKQTTTLIMDWLIIIVLAILVVVIYVPQGIWAEEEIYREESRRRMGIIWDAEDLYHTMLGDYTLDGEFLFKLISQIHDSLIADSTFTGNQIVHVDDTPHQLDIPEYIGKEMDTTFTVGRPRRIEVLDTVYAVTLWNEERADHDTLFYNGSNALAQVLEGLAFREVLDTTYGSHSEVYTDYEWNRFRLEPELLLCPVTGEPFTLSLDTSGSVLRVASPIEDAYVESRYLVFDFEAKDHGEIVDGEASWGAR